MSFVLFKSNFNKISLLNNIPITILFTDKTINFVPPSFKTYLTDLDFEKFLFLLRQTPDTVMQNQVNYPIAVSTQYELVQSFIMLNFNKDIIIKYFNLIFPNLEFIKNELYCNDIKLTNEEYDILLKMLLVSCGEEDYELFIKQNTQPLVKLSAMQQKLLEDQKRIDALKAKKEKKKSEGTITIDQIVVALLYEFPSLTLDRIYDMNMFTFYYFWSYVSKVVDNQIQISAAGNGTIKDFTYFIN